MSVSQANALSGAIALAVEDHPSRPDRADRARKAALRERIWGGVWLICAATGLGWMLSYQMTPAEPGDPVTRWPTETAVPLGADRLTALMFVHPRCPCTRASLTELSSVLQRSDQPVAAYAVILHPESADGAWSQGPIRNQATLINGLTVLPDAGGREHHAFGARTSGEVFVFRPSGELVFHGGVTAGRGHAGPNAGTQALDTLLIGLAPRVRQTPIYGCALDAPASIVAPARPPASTPTLATASEPAPSPQSSQTVTADTLHQNGTVR